VSPIRLIHHASFDPETTAVLGLAYEKASAGLADTYAREVVAKRIIEAARRGERDIERLVSYARGSDPVADASSPGSPHPRG
jgi:hypothetical protein